MSNKKIAFDFVNMMSAIEPEMLSLYTESTQATECTAFTHQVQGIQQELRSCNRCFEKKTLDCFYSQSTVCKACVKARSRCEHNRVRTQCRECKGSAFCIHDRRKAYCKLCKGSQLCIHEVARDYCKQCHGKRLCVHKYQKSYCKICKANQNANKTNTIISPQHLIEATSQVEERLQKQIKT